MKNKKQETTEIVRKQIIAGDFFLSEIRKMVEEGQVARMSGNALKSELILRIQSYSADIPLMDGQVSGVFLILCDLLMEGRLGKMQPEIFKVYLVLLAMNHAPLDNQEGINFSALRKFTGIEDPLKLDIAISQLEEDGLLHGLKNDSRGNSEKKKRKIFEVDLPMI